MEDTDLTRHRVKLSVHRETHRSGVFGRVSDSFTEMAVELAAAFSTAASKQYL